MPLYTLHPACRVRKEAFGLLFYDLRGPRLLFAETGDLLEPSDLQAGVTAEGGRGPVAGRGVPPGAARLARLLATLAEKGFLREQPVR
ncbi:MAG: mycofactocin biosynthesis chaperone MftB [Deferrisomatales bacterium]|nr:mycofactocin biosynthesis chaperone MftB [Deferrisomatales bacterium]